MAGARSADARIAGAGHARDAYGRHWRLSWSISHGTSTRPLPNNLVEWVAWGTGGFGCRALGGLGMAWGDLGVF